jgi:hypothetical protein
LYCFTALNGAAGQVLHAWYQVTPCAPKSRSTKVRPDAGARTRAKA